MTNEELYEKLIQANKDLEEKFTQTILDNNVRLTTSLRNEFNASLEKNQVEIKDVIKASEERLEQKLSKRIVDSQEDTIEGLTT